MGARAGVAVAVGVWLVACSASAEQAPPGEAAPASAPVASSRPALMPDDEASGLPSSSPPAAVPPERRWYGWQTMIVDGVVIAVSAPIAMRACDVMDRYYEDGVVQSQLQKEDGRCGYAIAGAGLLAVLGTPIVHAAHGGWGKAAAMFGARLVLPGIVGVVRAGAGDDGAAARMAQVVALGTLGMGLIDALILAYEPAPPPEEKPVGTSWYPRVDLLGNRPSLGVGGTF
jgi:hypothetical protein